MPINNISIALIAVFAIVIIAIIIAISSLAVIAGNEVGVVYDASGGYKAEALAPGWHFITPIAQHVVKVPTSRQIVSMYYWQGESAEGQAAAFSQCEKDAECSDIAISVPSKEGLNVVIDVSVFFKIPASNAVNIIKAMPNYKETVIATIRSSARKVAGGMAFTELYGEGRALLESGIYEDLKEKFDRDGITLEEVLIRDVGLPDQIKAAIESKQKTEQELFQKKTEVEKEKLEADRKIAEATGNAQSTLLKAEAEAKSIALQAEALAKNKELVELEKWKRWNGQLPQTYICGDSNSLPLINIPSQ